MPMFQSSVSGGGVASRLIELMDSASRAQILFGAPFQYPRTLSADETPTITASATHPSLDTDVAAQTVVLAGGAEKGLVAAAELTSSEIANLRKWFGGFNIGMRPYWRYYGYKLSNSISTPNGSTSAGNNGNMQPTPAAGLSPQWGIDNTGAGVYLDLVLDGDVLFVQQGAAEFALWVNDKRVSVAPGTNMGATYGNTVFKTTLANNSYVKIKFPSINRRLIRIGVVQNYAIGNLFLRLTDEVRPRFPVRDSMFCLTDSFGNTYSTTMDQAAAGNMLAKLGPSVDFVSGCAGTTGYGAPGTRASFAERLNMDIPLLQAMRAVFILAGQNDSEAQITANAPTVLAALRAKFPAAPIFMALTYAPGTYSTAAPRQAALQAAAAGVAGCYVVPTYGATGGGQGQWLTGTGRVGATTGDGNADVYVNAADAIHPSSPRGAEMWASNFMRGVYAICADGTVTL